MGMSVKIIDQNEAALHPDERAAAQGAGDPWETARTANCWQEEGIEQTDAFVAITGMDEANILMAMSAARQSGDCCKVVAKINRRSLMELVSQRGNDRQRGVRAAM